MSDELVKRLRKIDSGQVGWGYAGMAANRIEALEVERDALAEKLKDIEAVMVRRIKFAKLMKDIAASGTSKRREHHRMHALSEALGEIRKITGGKTDDQHTD